MTADQLFFARIVLGCIGGALLITIFAMPIILWASVAGVVAGATGGKQ